MVQWGEPGEHLNPHLRYLLTLLPGLRTARTAAQAEWRPWMMWMQTCVQAQSARALKIQWRTC
jgi:hypothetical protein